MSKMLGPDLKQVRKERGLASRAVKEFADIPYQYLLYDYRDSPFATLRISRIPLHIGDGNE